jgi:hypothetical protein
MTMTTIQRIDTCSFPVGVCRLYGKAEPYLQRARLTLRAEQPVIGPKPGAT